MKAPATWATRPSAQSSARATRSGADAAWGSMDQGQIERVVARRRRQPDGGVASSTMRARRADGDVGQPDDAETAHLEQTGQGGDRAGDAVHDVHAVVRHQVEAAREQAQQQVGLACTRWTDQQHAASPDGWRSSRGSA